MTGSPVTTGPGAAATLRSLAVFELAKGGLALLAGGLVIGLRHRDLTTLANHWLAHLHIAPGGRTAHALTHALHGATPAHLWLIACGCFVYALVRAVEAYGLWHQLVWAEWFALLSGVLYLPWELYEWLERATLVHSALLFLNTALILVLLWRRLSSRNASPLP